MKMRPAAPFTDMDEKPYAQESVEWNYVSIPKLQWWNSWSLEMDKWFHPTDYNECNYSSMLGFKLIHVSKMGPRYA